MSAIAAETTGSRRLPMPQMLALGAALLFAATLWLDTRMNEFPFFYHPDEPNKVDQLITGKWNFHHPLLMLGTAALAKKALHVPDDRQLLVELGRWCSAVFAAGGVVGFAVLGLRVRGWGGFWVVGLLMMTQHQVFELAHYFKEDTALFLGLSLVVVTLHVQHRRPGWDAALLLGAACGLCLSAKYLGAVMIIPAAVIMGAAQRGKRVSATQWGWFAAGLIAAAAVVNFPVFGHLDVFRHSFGRETELVAQGGRENMGGQVAIFEYIRIFVGDTNPVVWVLVGAEMIAIRRRGDVFDWTMGIFPFAFMLLLCCSTKTNDRYFLPATAGFHYLAALGALDLPGMLPVKWRTRLTPWKLAGVALLVNVGLLVPYLVAFAHDDRREMLDWIGANVPASAVIAGEERANLPVTTRPERLGERPLLAQRAMETPFAADLGDTPQALAGKGIRYVVVSESNYGIFFRKATTGRLTPEMQRKRAFYVALFKDYQPVWERERGTVIYLHPGLRVYRLGAG